MEGVDEDESVMDMNKRIVAVSAGVAVVAAIAIGGAAVASGGADSDEVSLSSAEGKDASAAALKETGGGTANSVEKDNENNSVWEVEVTRKDGSTVDVRLDMDFKVVAVEGDGEADDEGKDDKDNSEADDQEGPGAVDDDSDVGDDNSDKD